MTPRQIVEEWVRRFNSGDADGLAELYHQHAVNHQVVQARSPVIRSNRFPMHGCSRTQPDTKKIKWNFAALF